jgi:YVTN family beta-propeller protein
MMSPKHRAQLFRKARRTNFDDQISKQTGAGDFSLSPLDSGFFFLASALYGADVEQTTPPAAATFGYVANTVDNTVSVIATASNTVVATIPVGQVPTG